MTNSNATKDETAGARAGGNVESKGASQSEATAEKTSTRAGGNVESKGASGGPGEKEAAKEE